MRTLRRLLRLIAGLGCLSALAATEAPRTALLDFATQDAPGSEDPAVTDFSRAVQARLLTRDDFAWVERQEFDRLLREVDLAGTGRVNPLSAVRLGHWLRADLLLRGEIARPESGRAELTIEVIDLKRAELLATTKAPVTVSPRGWVRPSGADVRAAADAAAKALIAARTELQARSARRIVAPLFFRNVGRTDRLDFLEPRLSEALRQASTAASDCHVVRFPSTSAAAGESELVLAGLTDTDPDAWQKVADVYVWGSFQEHAADGVAFPEVPVTIVVNVWSGGGDPREVRWDGKAGDLDRGVPDLAGRVLAEARGARLEAGRTDADRRRISAWLAARAEEVRVQIDRNANAPTGGTHSNFFASPAGVRLWRHRVRLLEVACFFDALNRPLQERRMEAVWSGYDPPAPADRVRRQWECLADRQAHTRRFGRKSDGSPDGDLILLQTRTLERLMSLVRDQTWAPERDGMTSEEAARQIRSIVTLWGRLIAEANQPMRDRAQSPAWLPAANREWFHQAFANPGATGMDDSRQMIAHLTDAVVMRRALEQIWPSLQGEAGRCLRAGGKPAQALVDTLFGLYSAFADSAGAARLLDAAWSAAKEIPEPAGDAAAPPRPPGQAAGADREPFRADLPWAPPAAGPQPRPGEPPGAAAPAARAAGAFHPPAPAAAPVLKANLQMIDPSPVIAYSIPRSAAEHPGPAKSRTIDSLAVFDGCVWIAESGRALPAEAGPRNPRGDHYLWRYDPIAHTACLVTPTVGAHSVVQAILARENELWLGLDTDGVWRWNPAGGEVRRFTGEDGLITQRVTTGCLGNGAIFFVGGLPPDLLIAQYELQSGKWRSVAFPFGAVLRGIPAQFGVPPRAIAASGDWLCVAAPFVAFCNLKTGTWGLPGASTAQPPSPPAPGGPPATPAGRVGPPAILPTRCVSSDATGFWFGQINTVVFLDAGRPESKRTIGLPGTPVAAAHDGPRLWLLLARPNGSSALALVDKALGACTGALDLPAGTYQAIVASGNRVWIGGSALIEVVAPDVAPTEPGEARDLLHAAGAGNVAGVARAIAAKAPLDAAVESGWTPILAAAAAGRIEIIGKLLEAGANPNSLSRDGISPLQLAAKNGDLAMVELLLAKGAQPDLFAGIAIRGLPALRPTVAPPPPHLEATTLPADPVNARATASEDGSVTLTWSPGSGNESRFEIFRHDAWVACVPGSTTTWTDPSPPTGAAPLYYRVDAINGAGRSDAVRANVPETPARRSSAQAIRLGLVGTETEVALPAAVESQTALMAAADGGHEAIVRALLGAGANPNLQDSFGRTALAFAVRSGRGGAARLLLAQGARADLRDALGSSPADAVFDRHEDEGLLRALLSAMPAAARIEETSHLLAVAASRGQIRDLDLLLSLGADMTAATDAGESAISLARDRDTVARLIERGFPLHRKTLDHSGPVELADPALGRAIATGKTEILAALLQAGADPNRLIEGRPLLAHAMAAGARPAVSLLLERGADPERKSTGGKRPADFAPSEAARKWLGAATAARSSWPRPEYIPSILAGPHFVDEADDPARRAANSRLIEACKRNDAATAAAALSEGADLNARDSTGMRPLTYALKNRAFDVARWLVDNGVAVNRPTKAGNVPLNFAVEANAPDMIAMLLRAGADPNCLGARGHTPLMDAAGRPNRALAAMLLDAGADPNLAGWQPNWLPRMSPLAVALRAGNAEVADLLLARGANPKAQDRIYPRSLTTGDVVAEYARPSLLMYAAAGGNLGLVRKLIELGQDPRLQAEDGYDALAWAAGHGHDAIVQFLLPLTGHSPRAVQMATEGGYQGTVALLRRAGYE